MLNVVHSVNNAGLKKKRERKEKKTRAGFPQTLQNLLYETLGVCRPQCRRSLWLRAPIFPCQLAGPTGRLAVELGPRRPLPPEDARVHAQPAQNTPALPALGCLRDVHYYLAVPALLERPLPRSPLPRPALSPCMLSRG